ncbi:partial Actin cross-linking toxin VgrG1, partial [Anaerolineae bacterium]
VLAAASRLRLDAYFSQSSSFGGEKIFECSFTAVDSKQPYRPPRIIPKPLVHGAQTAIVVGPSGDEIYTDKYGRVKVHFHWDRKERWESGKKEEDSSCWIRVSHPWAGKGWGAISIPRIGQEVIVDFLEGDPDQPIITGRVYNADAMAPYPLPGAAVISGIKSNTHKGKGYNEMSMDDTAGKEKITIHGQYDMNTTVEHDQSLTVHNNRTTKVDGTYTETITKDTKIKIESGTYDHDVDGNTAKYHVKGALTEKYEDTQTTTVTNKIIIETKTAEVHVIAAKEIMLHTVGSKLVMKEDGTITLTGKDITIIGDSKIALSAPNIETTGTKEVKMGVGMQSVTCDTAKLATSGANISQSAVGNHEITGALVKIN